MSDHPDQPDPTSPDRNPLGLGPRDRDSSNTGSIEDTHYNAVGSDPYTTGEPVRDFRPVEEAEAAGDGSLSERPEGEDRL